MMNKLKITWQHLQQKDISARWYYAIGLVLLAGRLAFCFCQMLYVLTEAAPLDDGMMFNAAVSIANGQWLGEYNWLTLSKHAFYAVWLAFVHFTGVPLLAANQMLWAGACMLVVAAFRPVVSLRWQRLVIFGVLLYLPSAIAEYTLRVYRDGIFPALCLMLFACFTAVALRLGQPLKKSIGYLMGGGLLLGCVYLSREDGIWVLPFTLTATAITLVYILVRKGVAKRLWRGILLVLPYALAVGVVCIYCAVNNAYYGRFIVSDFTSREFSDVIGAMARVDQVDTAWQMKVSISDETLERLYENIESFAPIEEELNSPFIRGAYANATLQDEFSSGAFYWALRKTAQNIGVYDSPRKAQAYWQELADAINHLCDNGTLPATRGKTSSTMPPFRTEYIAPVTKEAFHGLWYCLSLQETYCYMPTSRSEGTVEDLQVWMDFTHDDCNYAAVAGGTDPYYPPLSRLAYKVMEALRRVYMVLFPLGFAAALFVLVRRAVCFFKAKKRKEATPSVLLWLVLLGFLLMAVLRCFIVAYVQVASFTIGTYVMYLAAVHPLLMTFTLLTFFGKAPQVLPNVPGEKAA